uniref:Reverse transcriptase domain-containing protein n=1 Tax=Tanacetum cinerariifolium TaxID=118510 RepID=A0A6L2K6V8_TANCI|nr:reverse transcriptase domain-containing protein [Tanacetum cinerariifolium]
MKEESLGIIRYSKPLGLGHTITLGPWPNQIDNKHNGLELSPESLCSRPGYNKTDADRSQTVPDKLKEVKSRLNFEGCSRRSSKIQEVSQHSESRTSNLIEEHGIRQRPRRSRSTSGSPEATPSVFSGIKRDGSESPGHRDPEWETVFTRTSKGKWKAVTKVLVHEKWNPFLESVTIKRRLHREHKRSRKVKIAKKDTGSQGRKNKSQALKKTTYPNHRCVNKRIPSRLTAAKVERWAMPTWCHMFNSTLTRSARKCIKDPVEIHHIKQREGESIEDFVQTFKSECRHVKGSLEYMRISGDEDGTEGPMIIESEIGEARSKENSSSPVNSSWNVKILSLRRNSHTTKQGSAACSETPAERSRRMSLVRQKKRSQAPERNMAIQEEVERLMEAGIMKEVHYHGWLSNPVMVKKHDDNWRMCVDFKDLNKACPKDGYPLSEIDWKVKSLCEYPFKCFLDVYKGYHQIKMAKKDEEKTAFITSQGIFCYSKTPFGLKNVGATYQCLVDKAFQNKLAETWRLNEKLASLNRFLAKSAEKSLPFFKTLKKYTKESDFQWTTKAKAAFKQMKNLIAELSTLTAPMEKEELIMYLTAAKEAVSTVLMTEREAKQMPIYFVSRALQDPKINYTPVETLVLDLVHASKRLKRLQKLSIELGEYDIYYRPRVLIKGQILADFMVEQPKDDSLAAPMEVKEELPEPWTLFMDTSSCLVGSEAGLILTNLEGTEFTYALRFEFNATNNEADYEALIADVRIAEQMGIKNLQTNVDSCLVANQVNGSYIAKEPGMIQYLKKVKTLTNSFKKFSIKQMPRSKNKKADALKVLTVMEEEGNIWITLIYEYLTKEILPTEKKKAMEARLKSRHMHAGPRSVVAKSIRTGYYWPTMHKDVKEMIQECQDCQVYRPVPRDPQQKLTPITSPWPFYKWGIDIAGPFLEGPSKRFASVKHPQSNGLVERANKILGEGIKSRLDKGSKDWIEEIPHVLWVHRTMIKSSNEDTSFSLTYGTEIVILAKLGMPTMRTTEIDMVQNDKALKLNLGLLEEKREQAAIHEARSKAKMEKYYNSKVRNTSFKPRDLVYQSNDANHVEDGGKLGPKWEGPYELMEALG